MSQERFTELPIVTSALMTDIICAVQGFVSAPNNLGLSVQQTLGQVYDLFQSNIILYNAGNPNGAIAGNTYQLCWDTTNFIMYVCTSSGTDLTAVWSKIMALTAGTGIAISQSGNDVVISSSAAGVAWNQVTVNTPMLPNNGYQVITGSNINLALPASSVYGDEISIMGVVGGLWTITQGAGQKVTIGSVSSSNGGSVSATSATDSLTLVCVQNNLIWQTLGGPQGNLLIV